MNSNSCRSGVFHYEARIWISTQFHLGYAQSIDRANGKSDCGEDTRRAVFEARTKFALQAECFALKMAKRQAALANQNP